MHLMNIKTPATALALASVLGSLAGSASAAESVDLTVTGNIIVGSCTPVFDSGGVVDFGKKSSASLSADSPNDLGTKSINLTITCDAARSGVAFNVVDNRKSSAPAAGLGTISATSAFGLGQTAGAVNLGAYSITLASVTLDGTAGAVVSSADQGGNWAPATGSGLVDNTGNLNYSAAVAGATTTTGSATIFVYRVDVNAILQDTTTLAISSDTDLDGSATFTVAYL